MAVESRSERSYAIYPKQELPLSFSHELHLEQEMECDACHGAIADSTRASDLSLPGHPECELCHDIEAAKKGEETDPPADCGVCHLAASGRPFDASVHKAPRRVVIPTPNLTFNHKVHLDQKIGCD